MSAIYITCQLRRPSRDGKDPGSIAEGWYQQDGDHVQMCNQDGTPLAGEKNRKKLRPGQTVTVREAAAQLLKAKASMFSASRSFNRPLHYPISRY
jgi:hypothetical protein